MATPIWARQIARGISSNSPTIMSGLAVVGVVATAVLAARATPKAVKAIEETRVINENLVKDNPAVEIKDQILITWKYYLPAAVSGACTVALIVGSNRIGVRRQIAMAGAYALLDTAFVKYKDEVLEQIGATKEQRVRDGVLKKQMDANPPDAKEVIIIGGGDQLCYESLSGRYFRTTMEAIGRAQNEYNRNILNNVMYDDLNGWFEMLGLPHTALGRHLGFNVERGVDVFYTAHLSPTGEPCMAIGYKYNPFEDFGKL